MNIFNNLITYTITFDVLVLYLIWKVIEYYRHD